MLKRYPLNRDGVFIENFAIANELWLTLLALHFATQRSKGMKRDDGSNEIDHPTRVCCDLIDRAILLLVPVVPKKMVDIILALALLHDSVENEKATLNEISEIFGDEIARYVDLITKRPEHKRSAMKYYRRLARSIVVVLVKSVDKENVAGTIIAVATSARRLKRQANEVRHLLPIMKKMRNRYPEFKGILISCRNHLQNSLLALEKHAKLMVEVEKLRKENKDLRRRRRKNN